MHCRDVFCGNLPCPGLVGVGGSVYCRYSIHFGMVGENIMNEIKKMLIGLTIILGFVAVLLGIVVLVYNFTVPVVVFFLGCFLGVVAWAIGDALSNPEGHDWYDSI